MARELQKAAHLNITPRSAVPHRQAALGCRNRKLAAGSSKADAFRSIRGTCIGEDEASSSPHARPSPAALLGSIHYCVVFTSFLDLRVCQPG